MPGPARCAVNYFHHFFFLIPIRPSAPLSQTVPLHIFIVPDGSCDSVCDIAFLLDASGSIEKEDYVKQKHFVTSVARHLGIGRNGPHYGIILFSYYARLNITFDQYYDQESFEKAVMNLKHPGSVTRIDKGLKLAYDRLFTAKGKEISRAVPLNSITNKKKDESHIK